MKLGRDFTNFLLYDYLDETQKRALASGRLDLVSAGALALNRAKADVERQLGLLQELGFEHLELDADPPSPYLDFSPSRKREVREAAEAAGVSLSLHLPYSYGGSALCCPQPEDRRVALRLHLACLRFASEVGCRYAVVHPGQPPFYQTSPKYLELAKRALVGALAELSAEASRLGIALCLENNSALSGAFFEPEELLEVVQGVRDRGRELYLNFDLGLWLTRADAGMEVQDPPELVLEPIPPEVFKELHLNDYVAGERRFHPLLHLGWGMLKRANLQRFARIAKRKGVEVVVLESALQNVEQVFDRMELLKAESKYVREVFEEA